MTTAKSRGATKPDRLSVATVIDSLHEDPSRPMTVEEWSCVVSFCAFRARHHYQQRQKKGFRFVPGGAQQTSSNPLLSEVTDDLAYERYMGRVLLFLDFVAENPNKSGAWVMFVYRCRFSYFEAILEAQVHGVGGMFTGTTLASKLSSYPLKKVVEAQTILRNLNAKPQNIEALENELRKTNRKRSTIKRMVQIYAGWLKARYVDQLPEDKQDNDN